MQTIVPLLKHFFPLIDRYLLKEFSLYLFAVTGVLWLIFVATRFSRYLAQAAVGSLPSDIIFTLLGYNSLTAFSLLLPMATFLAITLALARMNADHELTVLASCGISQHRLVGNVMLFSAVVAVIVALLAFIWVPNALDSRYKLEQGAKLMADTSSLIAGTFKESRNGEWTFYSQKLTTDNNMENIFIEVNKKEQRRFIFRAAKGHFEIDANTGDKYLILEDGYRYQGEAGQQNFTIAQYGTHTLLVEKQGVQAGQQKQKALPSSLLWQRGQRADLAELQWRASSVIMTILLSLMATRLAKTAPRQGRYAGLLPAILIYIIYSNLLGINRAWVAKGIVIPWLGAIWVHLLIALLLLLMFNWNKVRQFSINQNRKTNLP